MQSLELKVPPVLVAIITGGLMWAANAALPALALSLPWRRPGAVLLVVLGAVIGLAGVLAFREHRTTVDPTRPDAATALVHAGIYRYTRNPMYVGLALGLAAGAWYSSNAAALALLPAFVAYITRFQILPEERALRDRFGAPFEAYMARVRRWV